MSDPRPMEIPEPIDHLIEVLAQQGPLTEPELVAELAQRGVEIDDPELVLDEAAIDSPVAQLADGRWAWLPALLAGRMFTHRLTGDEISHDVLRANPDLEPLSFLLAGPDYQRLTDGSPIIEVLPSFDHDLLAERGIPQDVIGEHGGFLLPPGQLRAIGANEGDVVGLRVTPDGLRLETIAAPLLAGDAPQALGQRLGTVLADDPERPVELDIAVWTACADDPTLFTEALAPLGSLIDALGLSIDGEWLAGKGFDFDRWRTETTIRRVALRYDLGEDEALAVQVAVTLHHRFTGLLAAASAAHDEEGGDAELTGVPVADPIGGEDREIIRATAGILAEPVVAEAVLHETAGTDPDGAAALGLFAETLEPLAPREARAALRWLRAKAFELLDDVLQAEATLEAAETLDPQWPPTLVDLARYASDRGDAARGLNLLRRADTPPDHPLRELLEQFHPTPRTDLGRNEPCWCGSGRKYKKCHLHQEELPLDERAAWLYQKASMFLHHSPWQADLIDVAAERAAYAESDEALITAATDPLVTDAVLFEGGAFAHFVATRGVLLPDDERLLAEQWLLVERSVFEVDDVRPGDGVTVRDLRTGDVHQVRERTASLQLRRNDLLCARVVPLGDTMQFFGGIEPVELRQRDQLLELLDSEPEADELVAVLTSRFAPPTLSNTEGHPLAFCEATLQVSDPAPLTDALDGTYDRSDDSDDADAAEWIEHVTTHGMQRIGTFLRLHGDEMRVHTNSEERFDRVLTTLRALDPEIRVIDESRQQVSDIREASELAMQFPHPESSSLDPADPEVAAALRQFIRDYERKWLDEPIPALAGLTPRQAADDPTRRDDLIKLLDSFPAEHDNPGAMNPDRLRADLDLP